MPSTQAGEFISITTPLDDDVLLLRSFTGQEGISQLFRFRLELGSEKPPIRLESIIGQNVTVNMIEAAQTAILNATHTEISAAVRTVQPQ